jgi:hypothetical protein
MGAKWNHVNYDTHASTSDAIAAYLGFWRDRKDAEKLAFLNEVSEILSDAALLGLITTGDTREALAASWGGVCASKELLLDIRKALTN